jgi:hypothetical protein
MQHALWWNSLSLAGSFRTWLHFQWVKVYHQRQLITSYKLSYLPVTQVNIGNCTSFISTSSRISTEVGPVVSCMNVSVYVRESAFPWCGSAQCFKLQNSGKHIWNGNSSVFDRPPAEPRTLNWNSWHALKCQEGMRYCSSYTFPLVESLFFPQNLSNLVRAFSSTSDARERPEEGETNGRGLVGDSWGKVEVEVSIIRYGPCAPPPLISVTVSSAPVSDTPLSYDGSSRWRVVPATEVLYWVGGVEGLSSSPLTASRPPTMEEVMGSGDFHPGEWAQSEGYAIVHG